MEIKRPGVYRVRNEGYHAVVLHLCNRLDETLRRSVLGYVVRESDGQEKPMVWHKSGGEATHLFDMYNMDIVGYYVPRGE